MSKISTSFYENVVYPVYQFKFGFKFGFEVIKTLRQITKYQWVSRDELLAFQTKKLKRLIQHAYDNVTYYREVMEKLDLKPEDIKSVEDIKYLPLLTKEEIRKNQEKFVSKDIRNRNTIPGSTGGSTGEPLKFVRDWNTHIWTEAALLRGMSWAQFRIGDTFIDFMSPGWPSILGKIRTRMIGRYCFPALAKYDVLASYMKKIKGYRPFCLAGYTSNLYRIAKTCHKRGINDIEIPVIFTTAEMLYDFQRDFLEKQFNSSVFDYYGCNELGSIAFECEYKNKHISNEHVIVETTNSKGDPVINSLGEITVTDLDNYAMPFIRYKIGDTGIIPNDVCACGRSLKIIKSIDGRTQEFLRTLDGNYVPAVFFPARFRNLVGIDQYQIVQTDIHVIVLKIVKNRCFSARELEGMMQIIREMIGNDITITVEEHRSIPLTRRGKVRLVMTNLKIELL